MPSLQQQLESGTLDYYKRFGSVLPPAMVRSSSMAQLLELTTTALETGKPYPEDLGDDVQDDLIVDVNY